MTTAEIPSTYDLFLQRLIAAQDRSMLAPPFPGALSAIVKPIARSLKKGGKAEETFRVLGRGQPNVLRSEFAGVESALTELDGYALPDLQALRVCHEANRKRMERRFRVRFVFLAGMAGTILTAMHTIADKLPPEVLSMLARSAGFFWAISGAAVTAFLLVWFASFPILGRLEVVSDLIEIVIQKKSTK